MTNIAGRLAKLEKESTATLPRIAGVWLIPVAPEATAGARARHGSGLGKLPSDAVPQFVSWVERS